MTDLDCWLLAALDDPTFDSDYSRINWYLFFDFFVCVWSLVVARAFLAALARQILDLFGQTREHLH